MNIIIGCTFISTVYKREHTQDNISCLYHYIKTNTTAAAMTDQIKLNEACLLFSHIFFFTKTLKSCFSSPRAIEFMFLFFPTRSIYVFCEIELSSKLLNTTVILLL